MSAFVRSCPRRVAALAVAAALLGAAGVTPDAEARKLRNRLNVYRRHTTSPRRMRDSIAEHARIADAIEAGEETMAHQLMREHVDILAGTAADVLLALERQMSA